MSVLELNELSLIDDPVMDDFSDEDDEDCNSCWTIVGSEPEFVKYIEYLPQPQDLPTAHKTSFLQHWRQLIVLLIVALYELNNRHVHGYANPVVVVMSVPIGANNRSANYSMPTLKLTLPHEALNLTSADNSTLGVVVQPIASHAGYVALHSAAELVMERILHWQTTAMTMRIDHAALVQLRENAAAAVDRVVDVVVDVVVDSVLCMLNALDHPAEGNVPLQDAETVGTSAVVGRVVLTVLFIVLCVHLHGKYA